MIFNQTCLCSFLKNPSGLMHKENATTYIFSKMFKWMTVTFKYTLVDFIWVFQLCHGACGIPIPQWGLNPGPWPWKHCFLTTGPPGKSLDCNILQSSASKMCFPVYYLPLLSLYYCTSFYIVIYAYLFLYSV